jgi:hypothetical protein
MRVYFSCVSLAAAILVLLAACYSFLAQQPPQSALNPPVYPGAQQVQDKKSDGERGPIRVITFERSSTPTQVLGYYTDLLQRDGWELHTGLSEPSKLYFGWVDGASSSPAYELYVDVKSSSTWQTHVELTLKTTLPL